MRWTTTWIAIAGIALSTTGAGADDVAGRPDVRALEDELARAMTLELPGLPRPYYASYGMWDQRWVRIEAEYGALVSSRDHPRQSVDIVIRVGDHTFDNSNMAESFGGAGNTTLLGRDDDYDEIRRDLWLETDAVYKRAVETLERKKALAKTEIKISEAPSFSTEKPASISAVGPAMKLERAPLEDLARKLSAVFRANPDVYQGSVSIVANDGTHTFVSSEGTISAQSRGLVRITISCETQADDGMRIARTARIWANTPDQLPPEAELIARVEGVSRELSALRAAPVVDADYSGPVLFTSDAAGKITRALLAHHVAGTPAPSGMPGSFGFGETALAGKVGQRILPAGVTIVDDPTAMMVGAHAVFGGYRFDEEGVAAQKVAVVEDGMFKRFLMSRTPRKDVARSTGHGRSASYVGVRAHPTNLIVTARKRVSDKQLRKQALAAARAEGLPYVLVIESFSEQSPESVDFADPAGMMPAPGIVKRLYPDGREELVRGASLASIPLRALRDLLAIGTTATPHHFLSSGFPTPFDVFSDTASSGFPVSIVAPPLLFRAVDVKKPTGSRTKPPFVPRPRP